MEFEDNDPFERKKVRRSFIFFRFPVCFDRAGCNWISTLFPHASKCSVESIHFDFDELSSISASVADL